MDTSNAKNRKYVFLYPDIATPTIAEIEAGRAPRERLTGFYQLLRRGWDVNISDKRWQGKFASIRKKLKRFVFIPSFGMVRDCLPADVIVVKDDFSLGLTLLAKLLGKKIVYLDSMFKFPKNRIRDWLVKLNLLLANQVICFSQSQADLWASHYSISRARFHALSYGMDLDFYSTGKMRQKASPPQVLSIGRDVGRDFSVLTRAVADLNVSLNLITLPYLLPAQSDLSANTHVHERVSYDTLMSLYSQASIAVVPLKSELSYPSGIRAVMEAVLLGVPVISTYTPVLEEYFSPDEEMLYIPPGDVDRMRSEIERLAKDDALAERLSTAALEKIRSRFSVDIYGDQLEEVLEKLF
ncbi:glycosyltransferase family 4 protein [Marinobacter fonticola]|uniref:glycosyltransferase family 4 protein n=1 Tax=Marinobacter fonticola TaxID=2603215 RepID=UPI0011E74257|nr:glycosyltransferase family 4 protein [Marinobacter fonticola]